MSHSLMLPQRRDDAHYFPDSAWLASSIQHKQYLIASSRNEFHKEFFNLMNNALHGKTPENLKKRRDIKLSIDDINAKNMVLT